MLGPVYDFEGFANQLALCDVSLDKSVEVLFMGFSHMDGVTTAEIPKDLPIHLVNGCYGKARRQELLDVGFDATKPISWI